MNDEPILPQPMPPLTDTMRAVLRNEHYVYDTEDDLYAALCVAAQAPAQPTPSVEMEAIAQLRHLVDDLTIEVVDPVYPSLTRRQVAFGQELSLSNMAQAAARLLQDLSAQAPAQPAATPLSNFIQSATPDEKSSVYERVIAKSIKAQREAAQPAPNGWQTVPTNPTPAMSAAGLCVSEAGHDPAGVYRAMVAAAPAQPALAPMQVGCEDDDGPQDEIDVLLELMRSWTRSR